jgi:hypothetical protein
MKNQHIIIAALIAASVAFTGCETIQGTIYQQERVQAGVIETDSVLVDDNKYISVAEFIAAGGNVSELDPSRYLAAGTPIYETRYTLRPSVETGINQVASFVPGGGLIGAGLSGILGIAAIWMRRKEVVAKGERDTANRVSQSLVQGIDVFRDILDNTDQGDKIDKVLTDVLRDRQAELQVLDKVRELLRQYETPTKSKIDLI